MLTLLGSCKCTHLNGLCSCIALSQKFIHFIPSKMSNLLWCLLFLWYLPTENVLCNLILRGMKALVGLTPCSTVPSLYHTSLCRQNASAEKRCKCGAPAGSLRRRAERACFFRLAVVVMLCIAIVLLGCDHVSHINASASHNRIQGTCQGHDIL